MGKEITGLQEQLADAQDEAALERTEFEGRIKESEKLRQELEDSKRAARVADENRVSVARQLSSVRMDLDVANKRISKLTEQQTDQQGMQAENKVLYYHYHGECTQSMCMYSVGLLKCMHAQACCPSCFVVYM